MGKKFLGDMEWDEHYGVAAGKYKGCEYVFLVCEWFTPDQSMKQGVQWSLRVTPEGKLIELIQERDINYLARVLCGPEGTERVTDEYEREIKPPKKGG